MAIYRQKYKVGDTVYRSFATYNPGIVLEVDYTGEEPKMKVGWIDGQETWLKPSTVASFDDLINDHLKKASTHFQKIEVLKVMFS